MARREIAFLPNQYYHIYNRGVNREPIFRADRNYYFLLQRFKENLPDNQVSAIAYCLMPNHYHFLLRQDGEIPISALMQAVFNSYTKAFNKAYARSGTLFEGPFRAVGVDTYEYLLHLCRYIHRNPLEAGLVNHPANWVFSNYLEWIGKRQGSLVEHEFVQENFPDPAEYEGFVLDYTPPEKVAKAMKKFEFD
ncbi:MAG: transposase [Chloroflexi bacterium]|nr:transposase [Chloroflexota bacterium]